MNMSAKSGANQFRRGAYLGGPSDIDGRTAPDSAGAGPAEPARNTGATAGGGGGGPDLQEQRRSSGLQARNIRTNQPQSTTTTVPTIAELTGNFNGVLKSGKQITITDPLTGLPFANNTIPSNRINPVMSKLLSYYQPATTQSDTGVPNLVASDLLPNQAYQWTTKIDHHFNDAVSASGFVLRQVTHEASSNYNPA